MSTFKGMQTLKSASARLALPESKRAYWAFVSAGVSLGYRRNRKDGRYGGVGTWLVRVITGDKEWSKAFANADDLSPENKPKIMSHASALEYAQALAQAPKGGDIVVADTAPIKVEQAIKNYEADLLRRGGDTYNARRLKPHLPAAMMQKPVSLLTARELKNWCAGLVGSEGIKTEKITRSTVNRLISCFSAALALAADEDSRIPWHQLKKGLKKFGHDDMPVDYIISDAAVLTWVALAHERSRKLGILMDVLAETGTRPSQAARIPVSGFKDGAQPKLVIPRSGKGGTTDRIGRKRKTTVSLISLELAAVLRAEAKGRGMSEPLLTRESGTAWNVGSKGQKVDPSQYYLKDVRAIVAALVEARHIDTAKAKEITAYALRHSSIVRNLLNGVPMHVVATNHDTSEAKIASNYGHHIDKHADEVAARGVLRRAPATDNVIPLAA